MQLSNEAYIERRYKLGRAFHNAVVAWSADPGTRVQIIRIDEVADAMIMALAFYLAQKNEPVDELVNRWSSELSARILGYRKEPAKNPMPFATRDAGDTR